jgi:excinuclease UvrABC helicase subunit UvrB
MISILVSYQYEIYRTTVRENCSVFSVKYDIVFVLPNTNSNSAIRIEIPPFFCDVGGGGAEHFV